MSAALAIVADHLRRLKAAHLRYDVNNPDHLRITKECLASVANLIDVVTSMPLNGRKEFVKDDTTAIVLHRIYDTFIGKTAEKTYYGKRKIAQNRSVVDKLFNTLAINKPISYFNYLPTRIFTEFCKGITYFAGEDLTGRPIYHRPASCGPNTMTKQQKFSIPKGATPSQIEAIHRATRLCYMERLIYDKIFQQVLHYQDVRHEDELKGMERLYQDYYGDETLDIVIRFNDELPIKLEVTMQRNRTLVIETYAKRTWSDSGDEDVVCTKQIIGNTIREWHKRQGFVKQMPWSPKLAATLTPLSRRHTTSWGGKNNA